MRQWVYSKRHFALLVLVLGIVAFKSHALEIESIEIIDLGTLPGDQHSNARDINDEGVIVGESINGTDVKPFIYRRDTMRELPILTESDTGRAYAINNHGRVVGIVGKDGFAYRGVIWEAGRVRNLGVDPGFGDFSYARDINDDGLIAGNIGLNAVVWRSTGTSGFPPFTRITDPGLSEGPQALSAHGINRLGQVAGTNHRTDTAFRWRAGTYETLPIGPVVDEYAFGINNAGKVVGIATYVSDGSATQRAALWPRPDELVDLATLGGSSSIAYDINGQDIVVGYSKTVADTNMAFVWHEDFGMLPLGTLGGDNSQAFAINARGNIVGYSETAEGERHATLWIVTYSPRLLIPWLSLENLACFPFITCPSPYTWLALIIVFAIAPLVIVALVRYR
ncbi:MAG: DUF3466 family protein [Saccharospirillum sp.]|uniref:DUF3466 family protein n=1 Tax=Saccharospirillum sp. TaxID=2033801 RepID=UPI003296B27B